MTETRTSDKMYDVTKPSYSPFQWVESEYVFKIPTLPGLKLMAYGAYNAMGLIGPEMGGLAMVVDGDRKFCVAKKYIPYSMKKRNKAFSQVLEEIEKMGKPTPQQIYDYLTKNDWLVN